jgi:hypothetical protein
MNLGEILDLPHPNRVGSSWNAAFAAIPVETHRKMNVTLSIYVSQQSLIGSLVRSLWN